MSTATDEIFRSGDEPDAARILLVCRANVARSPLAAALLRAALAGTDIEVDSAGVQATAGAPPARGTVELAARRGLDLTAHRSRPVSLELLTRATLVVTMSESHRDLCARMGAGVSARAFTLRELDRLTTAAGPPPPPGAVAAEPVERLRGLVTAAHEARPSAPPPPGPEDIADPMGRDWEAWFALADELEELLGRIVARLRPSAH